MEVVKADFDRLAGLERAGWSHNSHYHPFLLRHAPERCDEALDVGCGTGTLARLLAGRARHVVGLDLSPEMIRVARQRSAGVPNVEFQVADVLDYELGTARLDCIASIATLHHLPLAATLERLKRALRPGGVLLVLDLCEAEKAWHKLWWATAVVPSVLLRLWHTGRLRDPAAERAAWAEHGRHDHYLAPSHIRRACHAVLPGAAVRLHWLWRYSIVWTKSP